MIILPAFAMGEVRIIGEGKVPPYTLVRLRAEGVDNKAGLVWRVYPSKGVSRASTGKGLLEFVAPPGSYEVELLAITVGTDNAVNVDEGRLTVTIGDAPPPGPGPGPGPEPDPTPPLADKVWAVVVIDNDNKTPEQAKVVGDLEFWKGLEPQGHRWRILSKNNALVTSKGYSKYVTSVGLPLLVLQAPDGKVLKAVKLPASTEAVSSLIKEVTKR
jgi:hypothetical protein